MDPALRETSLNIHDNAGRLPISHNLALALRHLRSPTHALPIWADAVCINQADVSERNSQVALMSFIYKRAMGVVVWLGMPDIASGKRRVRLITRAMARGWRDGKPVALAAALADALAERRSHLDLEYTKVFEEEIKQSPYWTRLWIVQEVCLARNVVFAYGDLLWNSEQVREAAAWGGSPAMKALVETRERRYTDATKLGYLIQRFGKQKCSDIRDRIYGLLGLSDSDIPVDYAATPLGVWLSVVCSIAKITLEKDEWSILKTEDNLIWLSCVVQKALEGQVASELTSQPLPPGRRRQICEFPGFISRITAIGPSYDQISSAIASRDWAGVLFKEYHGKDREYMREIEDQYYEKIAEFEPVDLESFFDPEPLQVIAVPSVFSEYTYDLIKEYLFDQLRLEAPRRPTSLAAPVRFYGTNCCTGLVCAEAREGDYIIRFNACLAAIVMRRKPIQKTIIPIKRHPHPQVYTRLKKHIPVEFLQQREYTPPEKTVYGPEGPIEILEYIGRVDVASLPHTKPDPPHDTANVYADWFAVQKIAANVDVLPLPSFDNPES